MHPGIERWVELVQGSVDGGVRDALEAHRAGCDACTTLVEDLRRVLGAMSADRLQEPSPAVTAQVMRALRGRAEPERPAWARGLREVVARLVFDSWGDPALAFAGTRSAASARRLRFEADGVELDVQIESRGDHRRLIAQALAPPPAVAPLGDLSWTVLAGGRALAGGKTDAGGELLADFRARGDVEIHLAHGRTLTVFRVQDWPEAGG